MIKTGLKLAGPIIRGIAGISKKVKAKVAAGKAWVKGKAEAGKAWVKEKFTDGKKGEKVEGRRRRGPRKNKPLERPRQCALRNGRGTSTH